MIFHELILHHGRYFLNIIVSHTHTHIWQIKYGHQKKLKALFLYCFLTPSIITLFLIIVVIAIVVFCFKTV